MDLGLRLTTAACVAALPILPLGARLIDLQILRHGSLQSRAQSEFERVAQEAVPRADILDRDGRPLAVSVPCWTVFADKAMIKDPGAFAARLSPLISMPAADIAGKIRAASRFAKLKVGLDLAQASAVRAARLSGAGLAPSQRRVYPNGDLALGVLGKVGADGRGLAGLELALDARLRGTPRRLEILRDGAGRSIYQSVADDGSTPAPVRLTIDRDAQYLAESALAAGGRAGRFKGGAIAVEDPRDGELLALASWPSTPLREPLVQDAYEPGSTFKIVTALAALDAGLVRPDETFFGEHGRYEVSPGVVITDHEGQGDMTLAQILEKSSNIGISKVVARVGATRFYRMARLLGFSTRTGAGLPGETSGEVRPVSELTKVALASSSFGYGVQVSPLQVVGAYSAVANGGTLWEPKLLLDGQPPQAVRRVAAPEAVRSLAAMLEGVVERGTGTRAQIPGYRVAGKTGTARRIDPRTHRYSTTDYNASFVGFFPASDPRWTILVVLNSPRGSYYGGSTAAPIFADLARALLSRAGAAPDAPQPPAAALVSRR